MVCIYRHSSLLAVSVMLAGVGHAATLLQDDFSNGNLGSNPGIGGGFAYLDNGQGAGTAVETGSVARMTDGANNSTVGIYSTNAFDLSDSALTYTVTWNISNWDLGVSSGATRRLFFALQTNDSFLFTGDAEESRMFVEIDAELDAAYFRYQNRSGGSNSNFTTSPSFGLGSFTTDTDGFTATMVLDSLGFSFTTSGLDAANQVNISDTWANLGTDFTTALGTDGGMHVSIYNQNIQATGQVLDVDSINLISIPEPSIALLGGLGSLLLLRRRV